MLTINENDFKRLHTFVKSNYGINLAQKKHLIEGRLSTTLITRGYTSFTPYVDLILSNDKKEVTELLNKVTTNHTYFYRESVHFEYFKNVVLPFLEKTKTDRSINVWCAASSSGEEPYTLAMILDEYFGSKPQRWDTRVLATDISEKILATAVAANYKTESIEPLPQKYQKSYFKTQGDDCTVVDKIKNNVIFKRFNLMDPISFKVKFDVIFCRNVMIYFDQNDKNKLIERFYNASNSGSFLFVGLSENIDKDITKYKYVQPATYRKV